MSTATVINNNVAAAPRVMPTRPGSGATGLQSVDQIDTEFAAQGRESFRPFEDGEEFDFSRPRRRYAPYAEQVVRFSGVFVIRPAHNPIGPFQFGETYDETSDRRRTRADLLQQGYDDAYRLFIEPIVASGERMDVI